MTITKNLITCICNVHARQNDLTSLLKRLYHKAIRRHDIQNNCAKACVYGAIINTVFSAGFLPGGTIR